MKFMNQKGKKEKHLTKVTCHLSTSQNLDKNLYPKYGHGKIITTFFFVNKDHYYMPTNIYSNE